MGSWRAFSNLSTALSANLVPYSTSHSLYSLQFVFTQSSLWPSLKPGSPLKRTHSPEAPSRGDRSFSLTPCAYTGRWALPSLCTPVLHPHHYSQGGEKKISALWWRCQSDTLSLPFPIAVTPQRHTRSIYRRVWCPAYCCHLESSMYTASYSITRIIVPHLVGTVGFLPIWMSSNPPPVAGGSTTLGGLRESK